MDRCEFEASCFYVALLENRPHAVKQLMKEFCDGNYGKCARYLLFRTRGRCRVPHYLLPEDMYRAHKIIDEMSK